MVLLPTKPIFTKDQISRLSNIFDNAGQVVFGVVVLSPLLVGFHQINWFVELCGIISTMSSWLISVGLAKKESAL